MGSLQPVAVANIDANGHYRQRVTISFERSLMAFTENNDSLSDFHGDRDVFLMRIKWFNSAELNHLHAGAK